LILTISVIVNTILFLIFAIFTIVIQEWRVERIISIVLVIINFIALGLLFSLVAFHILIIKLGITTYDYLKAMRDQSTKFLKVQITDALKKDLKLEISKYKNQVEQLTRLKALIKNHKYETQNSKTVSHQEIS
jgi:signal transduction histidine kinase